MAVLCAAAGSRKHSLLMPSGISVFTVIFIAKFHYFRILGYTPLEIILYLQIPILANSYNPRIGRQPILDLPSINLNINSVALLQLQYCKQSFQTK